MKIILNFTILILLLLSLGFAMRAAQGEEITPKYDRVYSYDQPEFGYLKLYKKAILKGNYKEAEQVLREGILKYPNFAPYYYNLSLILSETGRYAEAKESLKKFFELDPDSQDNPTLLLELKQRNLF